jgi:DNA-directed RNA polymerase specialized sigma24 family protein
VAGQRFWGRRRADSDRSPDEGATPAPVRLRVVSDDSYPDWEAVYNDNVDRVYRLMFAKVGNRPDAEDLAAEVFVTALRPLRLSASVGEVRAYLLATARTVLAGYWKRTLGCEITTLDEDWALVEPVDGCGDTGAVAHAEAILAELPERYRRILQLRFLGGSSLKEAAAELGVTVGNAKVLQHRALRQAAMVADRMEA